MKLKHYVGVQEGELLVSWFRPICFSAFLEMFLVGLVMEIFIDVQFLGGSWSFSFALYLFQSVYVGHQCTIKGLLPYRT